MGEEDAKNSSGLKSPINFKILGIIAGLSIALHVYLAYYFEEGEELQFGDVTYGVSSLAAGIVALIVAKRYWGSEVFGRSYTALGIAFLVLFAGDTTYVYYQYVLDEDPYPSIADVFFFATYPLLSIHLLLNLKNFNVGYTILQKIWVPVGTHCL